MTKESLSTEILAVCHIRSGAFQSGGPEFGELLHDVDLPDYKIMRGLRSGHLGLRRMFVEVEPDILEQDIERKRKRSFVIQPKLPPLEDE